MIRPAFPPDRTAAVDRRTFLPTAAAGLLAAARPPRALAGPGERVDPPARPPVAAFTKSFQEWPVPKVCEAFAELGLDGLDVTVRPGGHIEPENAAAELPAAVAAAEAAGVKVLMLTTAIADAGPDADRLLGVAAANGVSAVKLSYFRETEVPLAERMEEVRRTLAAIGDLAAKHGVTACLHTHSGAYVPSHGTMLYSLLKDLPPDSVGAYVDTLHMHVEGGDGGWRQGLELLAPWLRLCAVKNYRWEPAGADDFGMKRWKETVVPVADGFSPVPDFVRALKRHGFAGAFSLHSEYRGRGSWRDLDTAEVLEQTRADWGFFEPLLGAVYA